MSQGIPRLHVPETACRTLRRGKDKQHRLYDDLVHQSVGQNTSAEAGAWRRIRVQRDRLRYESLALRETGSDA